MEYRKILYFLMLCIIILTVLVLYLFLPSAFALVTS